MKLRLLHFLFIFFLFCDIHAQFHCYIDTREQGINYFNSKQYSKAKKAFEVARSCPDKPSNNDLNYWIKKCSEAMTPNRKEQGLISVDTVAIPTVIKVENITDCHYTKNDNGDKCISIFSDILIEGMKGKKVVIAILFFNEDNSMITNNSGLPEIMKETIVPKQDRINVKDFCFTIPYSLLNVENSGCYKMKYKVVVYDYESSLPIMSSDFRDLNFLYIADNDKYIDLFDVWWETENMLDRKGILLHTALCAYNMNNEEITIRTTILFGKDEKDNNIKKLVWKSKLIIENENGSEAHEYANIQSLIPMTEIFKIGKYSSISTFYTEILDKNGRILAKRGNSSIEDAKGKPYIDLRNVCVEDNIVKEEGFEGMMIHSNTYFYNMKGAKIKFYASFFQKDKRTPLKNARGEAVTMNWGYVVPAVFFHGYDMETFIPYFVIDNSDIEKESIEGGEKYTFHIRCVITDENGRPLTEEKNITINTNNTNNK